MSVINLFEYYEELAYQLKADGMDQQDIEAKLIDMGLAEFTASSLAEKVMKAD